MNLSFDNTLYLAKDLESRHIWRLSKDFRFSIDDKHYLIPASFETDLVSVPWLAWLFVPKSGSKADHAAVVHDYLIVMKLVPRKQADAVFLEALKLANMNKFKAYIMYSAVRFYSIWRSSWK